VDRDRGPERAGIVDVVLQLRVRVVGVLQQRRKGLLACVVVGDVLAQVSRRHVRVDERVPSARSRKENTSRADADL